MTSSWKYENFGKKVAATIKGPMRVKHDTIVISKQHPHCYVGMVFGLLTTSHFLISLATQKDPHPWILIEFSYSFMRECFHTFFLGRVYYAERCFVIFSCDQASPMNGLVHPFGWLAVCLSVRPSAFHTFFTIFPSSYHHESLRSDYQWQKGCPCKRSRSEVKGQGQRGQNPI